MGQMGWSVVKPLLAGHTPPRSPSRHSARGCPQPVIDASAPASGGLALNLGLNHSMPAFPPPQQSRPVASGPSLRSVPPADALRCWVFGAALILCDLLEVSPFSRSHRLPLWFSTSWTKTWTRPLESKVLCPEIPPVFLWDRKESKRSVGVPVTGGDNAHK